MLRGSFYSIDTLNADGHKVNALIDINADHDIFKGHFPGQPIVPGVCMMQIVREVMEEVAGSNLKIVNGDNLKFLSIINPIENPKVEVAISFSQDADLYLINATISAGAVIFFKLKGGLQRS